MGKDCQFECTKEDNTVESVPFYPEEKNTPQNFPFPSGAASGAYKRLKIIFGDSSDFFGRIIIYDLDVIGPQ